MIRLIIFHTLMNPANDELFSALTKRFDEDFDLNITHNHKSVIFAYLHEHNQLHQYFLNQYQIRKILISLCVN